MTILGKAEVNQTASSQSDMLPGKKEKQEIEVEESLEARIERLGRERPPSFSSAWHEFLFVFSIFMSQTITEYFVSGFNILLPTLIRDLDIPSTSSVWPATAFSLVIASTLMFWGRVGDQQGGYVLYVSGLAWLAVWSIIAGFSVNPMMLNFCRALQGVGAAAFLPTGVMLVGSAYRPGPRKNRVFAIYGSGSVIGFFIGIFLAGIAGQYTTWGMYFWVGGALAVITLVTSVMSIPNDRAERTRQRIESDWLGTVTIVSGIVLFVFSITESAHAPEGWRTPHIIALFVLSIVILLGAVYTEGWVAKRPLLPADVFAVKGMTPLLLSLLLLYGTVGNYLLFGTQYFQTYMGATPLQVVAWFTPMAIGGLMLTACEAAILHIVPGYVLLLVSGVGALGSQLLLALIPQGGNYWAWIMPSMVLATVGIDLSITLMMVFVTTTQPLARQGLAGGLVNSVLHFGIALCIGVSDIVRAETRSYAGDRQSYKNVFWLGVAAGGFSLLLMAIWGRIPRQQSDLTADERLELEKEASSAT